MSLTFGFYNSQNGDRVYSTEQISDFLDGLISDGIFAPINDGEHFGFQVVPLASPGMGVDVCPGKAWFNGTWTKLNAPYNVVLPSLSPLYNRIDAIVLTINKTRESRSNYIEVISGTAVSGDPEKPSVHDDTNIYRYVLAYVTIDRTTVPIAGERQIRAANIENNINVNGGIPMVDLTSPLGGNYPTTEQLLAQYKGEFDEWFDYMKGQLTTDAAGELQTEIDTRDDNIADEYDYGITYSNGDFSMNDGVLKKFNGSTWNNRKICDEIKDMKSVFQAGVDAVYNACVAEGVTPSASTPTAIASAIATIRNGGDAAVSDIRKDKTAYSGKVLRTGTFAPEEKTITASRSPQTVTPSNSGLWLSKVTVNKYPDASGTYKPTQRITNNDMSASNNYRYVDTTAVPNTNSGTYTFPSGDTGGTKDLGTTNSYRYVNAGNVYSKGSSDGYSSGHSAGYSSGYSAGYAACKSTAIAHLNNVHDTIINAADSISSRSTARETKTWRTDDDDHVQSKTSSINNCTVALTNALYNM